MNTRQHKTILIGIAVAVLMGLFPPWTNVFKWEEMHSEGPAGYSFILDPPQAQMMHTMRIDGTRLLIQWLVVGLAAYGSLLLMPGRSQK